MISKKHTWDVGEAGAHLRELIEAARTEGPQTITVEGEEAAVVVSPAQAREGKEASGTGEEARTGKKHSSLVEFFLNSPYPEIDLLADRIDGEFRDLDL